MIMQISRQSVFVDPEVDPFMLTGDIIGAIERGHAIPSNVMTAASSPKGLRLHLVGPFRVTDTEGNKIVIRGRKAQALLALVACAPNMERSRVWLRDKLWSESDETRSSTSLRQSLFELRRDLGPLAEVVLKTGVDIVALSPEHIWVDLRALHEDAQLFRKLGLTAECDLLEGFDIGDPEFEDWLQVARMEWADQAEALAALQPMRLMVPDRPDGGSSVQPLKLALLRSVIHCGDELSGHLGDRLVEQIVDGLRELMPICVLDLRTRHCSMDELAKSAEADFLCRLRVLTVGQNVTLTFFLHRARELTLEWSQSIQCSLTDLGDPEMPVALGFVAQNVDRLAKTLQSFTPEGSGICSPVLAGFTAMNMLFRLEEEGLHRALELLDKAEALPVPGQPVHSLTAGLRAYAASFSVGENLGPRSLLERERLHDLLERQLEKNPFNAVTLACLGHVAGYVLQEHERAGSILERAVKRNPAQPFAWDHLALHKIYIGDPESALPLARRAAQLGAYSPLSYSYDTTLAMAAALSGDYHSAARAGRSALQKQPRFKAALRYLMVSQAALGQRQAAEETRDRLLAADPEFVDPEIQRLRFGLAEGARKPILRLIKPLME